MRKSARLLATVAIFAPVFLCVFLLVPNLARSESDGPAIQQGATEINLALSYANQKLKVEGDKVGDSANSVSFSAFAGYFLTPMHELGGSVAVSYLDQGDVDATTLEIGPAYIFNLSTVSDVVVPYIGAQIGLAYVDAGIGGVGDSSTGFSWSVQGGIRFLVASNVSLNVQAGYKQYRFSINDASVTLEFIPVAAGFSILF